MTATVIAIILILVAGGIVMIGLIGLFIFVLIVSVASIVGEQQK